MVSDSSTRPVDSDEWLADYRSRLRAKVLLRDRPEGEPTEPGHIGVETTPN